MPASPSGGPGNIGRNDPKMDIIIRSIPRIKSNISAITQVKFENQLILTPVLPVTLYPFLLIS